MNYINLALMLQEKIAYILAYFPVVTLAGFLQAWFLNLVGDDKAKREGFMSLDPRVHFDTYGFMILLFPWQLFGLDVNIGFGKPIPTDLDGIVVSRFNFFKKLAISFSTTISYFIITFLFLLLNFIFNPIILKLGGSYSELSGGFGNSILKIVSSMLNLSFVLLLIFFIVNLVDVILNKFDTRGVIKNNPIFRLIFFYVIAILLYPYIRLLFAIIFGFLMNFTNGLALH